MFHKVFIEYELEKISPNIAQVADNVVEYYKFGMDSIASEIIHMKNLNDNANDMLLKLKTLLKSTNDMFKKIYDAYEMTTIQINYQYLWVKYSGKEVFDVKYRQNEISY